MDRVTEAVKKFEQGFNCAQAIFSTYASLFGLGQHAALKIGTSFGAGMARMAESCGAVTGAFMVLGLAFGRTDLEDTAGKDRTYEQVREFARRFKRLHGSILCRELLGYDIGTPEGAEKLKELNIVAERCPGFVRDSAEILEEILS